MPSLVLTDCPGPGWLNPCNAQLISLVQLKTTRTGLHVHVLSICQSAMFKWRVECIHKIYHGKSCSSWLFLQCQHRRFTLVCDRTLHVKQTTFPLASDALFCAHGHFPQPSLIQNSRLAYCHYYFFIYWFDCIKLTWFVGRFPLCLHSLLHLSTSLPVVLNN